MNKVCFKCKVSKPLNLFTKNNFTKDKCQSWCKLCMKEHQVWHYQTNVLAQYRHTRLNATKRGISWDINFDTWEFLRSQPCDYCGLKIETKIGALDRLDNSKGYELGNVVPCCVICNGVRLDIWTPAEMKILGAVIGSLIRLRMDPVTDPILPKRYRPRDPSTLKRKHRNFDRMKVNRR